jgi:acyl-CoA thioester hydrolase
MSGLGDKYPVVLHQNLIWRDMDAYQHINNAVYFRYFEDARIAYFKKSGIVEHMERFNIGPILASTHCDFRAPLVFPDIIQVAADVVEIGSKRFKMNYVVYSEKLNKIAAEGSGLVVYYNYASQQSCEIPQGVVSAIKVLQSRT